MSLAVSDRFTRAVGAARSVSNVAYPDRDPSDDRYYPSMYGFRTDTTSGKKVSHNVALTYSGVWAASVLIADTIATLPKALHLITKQDDLRLQEVDEAHPSHWLFAQSVNPYMTDVDFWSAQICYLLNWGNCFALKEFDANNNVSKLWLVHPGRIPLGNVKRNSSTGELTYYVNQEEGGDPVGPFTRREMLHISGRFPFNGFWGQGVIPHGSNSIGAALATDEYGARFYKNDASVGVVITYPNKLDKKTFDRQKESWAEYQSLGNSHAPLIADGDPKIQRLSIPNEAAQFLQTRQFNITEIARWYNLPPHLLRDLTRSSFSNIESESIHFVTLSLIPWITRIEHALNVQLLAKKDRTRRYFRFSTQELLRGDMQSRADFLFKLFQMGVVSINDILISEGMNPLDDKIGESRYVQVNLQTIEHARIKQELDEKLLTEPTPAPVVPGQPADPNADPASSSASSAPSSSDDSTDPSSSTSDVYSRTLINSPPQNGNLDDLIRRQTLLEDQIRVLTASKAKDDSDDHLARQSLLNGSRRPVVDALRTLDALERQILSSAASDYRTFASRISDFYHNTVPPIADAVAEHTHDNVRPLVRDWINREAEARLVLLSDLESSPIDELSSRTAVLYASWDTFSQKADEAFQ